MNRPMVHIAGRKLAALAALLAALACGPVQAEEPIRWLSATAYEIPKHTNNQGSGYFAIVPGLNGKLYIGTAKYGENCFLVEFDPKTKAMKVVVDAHQAIGTNAKGYAAQAKIHTRNNVGESGKIYFATKQGYPEKDEKWEDYPGGYPMVYDPQTGQTKVYSIPVPHHGIISITPDEKRGVAYLSTCADTRPESSWFVILDLASGKYQKLLDCEHIYAFIVVDHLGRAYHPIRGGDIARWDPEKKQLQRLKQTIDGQPPAADSYFCLPETHPINWEISPDRRTLYSLPMSDNQLYAYDLSAEGDTLPGRRLGTLIPGAEKTDCRAMCVGPDGTVWASVTTNVPKLGSRHHLVSYKPGEPAPVDHGPVAIANPDYTSLVDAEGKQLPWHHGIAKLEDGTVTTKFVILGIAVSPDNQFVYSLSLAPYTLLQVPNPRR